MNAPQSLLNISVVKRNNVEDKSQQSAVYANLPHLECMQCGLSSQPSIAEYLAQ